MHCPYCQGLIMEPGVSYCYSGEVCNCCRVCRPLPDSERIQSHAMPTGWLCVKCGKSNSPHVMQCPCDGVA